MTQFFFNNHSRSVLSTVDYRYNIIRLLIVSGGKLSDIFQDTGTVIAKIGTGTAINRVTSPYVLLIFMDMNVVRIFKTPMSLKKITS